MNGLRKLGGWSPVLAVLALPLLVVFAGCGDDDGPTDTTNHAPVIASVTVNPGTVGAGGSATITVVATDQDGDPLTYTYSPNGGSVSGTGASVTWTAPSPTSTQTYSVTVTVSDGDKSATGSGSLTVTAVVVQTRVMGSVSLPIGQSGDLGNARVAIYADLTDWSNDLPVLFVASQGTGASVTYTINNVPPGTYYLDVWKDLDNDGFITFGDYYGVYGSGSYPNFLLTPFAISTGQTVMINLEILLLVQP